MIDIIFGNNPVIIIVEEVSTVYHFVLAERTEFLKCVFCCWKVI